MNKRTARRLRELIHYLRMNPGCSKIELSEYLNPGRAAQAYDVIRRAVNLGIVEQQRPGGYRYKLYLRDREDIAASYLKEIGFE